MTNAQGLAISCTWDQFVSEMKGSVIRYSRKQDLPQFSCVKFSNDYRSSEGILDIYAVVIDVDNKSSLVSRDPVDGVRLTDDMMADPYISMDSAASVLEMVGVSALLYETSSSKENWNRFRMIINLSRPLKPNEYNEAMSLILSELGLNYYADAIDKCYKIPSQPYWYPGIALGSNKIPRIIEISGDPFFVPVMESEIVSEIVIKANQELITSDDWWKEFDGDFSTMDIFRLLDLQGLKYGKQQPSGAFPVDCPWNKKHKMKAYVILPGSGRGNAKWPIIKCSCASCKNYGLKDFLIPLGVATVNSHCARNWKFDKNAVKHVTDVVSATNPKGSPEERDGSKLATGDIAAMILKNHDLIKNDSGHIFEYNGIVWKRISKDSVKKYAQDLDSYYHSTKGRREESSDFALNLVMSHEIAFNNISSTDIAFSDGVYNIISGDLRPHRREDFLDSVINHTSPGKDSKCPIWIDCLKYIFDGEYMDEKIAGLQEFFGYILMSEAKYKKALIMYGMPDSGKSLILQVMQYMVGHNNSCCLDISQMNDPKSLSVIVGKRLNSISEIGSDARIYDRGFKQLVSCEDPVQIKFLYSNPLMYIPTCKHVLCGNTLPSVLDTSGATFNRLMIIKFNKTVPKKRQDPYMFVKLASEISGILKWSIEGALRLIKNNGHFTESMESAKLKDTYAESQNLILDFVEDNFEITNNPDDIFKFETMMDMMNRYFKRPIERGILVKGLFDMNIPTIRKSIGGSRCRWVLGIRPIRGTSSVDIERDKADSFSSSKGFGII